MKRSYNDMSTGMLPVMSVSDARRLKSILEGKYKLKVVKVTDISKPLDKPVDEIEEPEDDDLANENKLNRNNARMLQLNLKDSNDTEINALENERIESLNNLKPGWKVIVCGPVEVRCGNIFLERKHVLDVEPPDDDESQSIRNVESVSLTAPTKIEINSNPNQTQPPQRPTVVHIIEDWDEDDEDDCIVLD